MDTHTLTLKIAAEMASFLRDMKTAEKHLEQVAQAGDLLKGALGGLFAGISAGAAIGKLVEVQREFDKLNSVVKTLAGSQAAAEKEMAWIKDFAAATPYGLAQATQGFAKLKALGLDPSRAALTSYGNTAAAMGKDLMQMIEAVADASVGEFERLKEFGIKAKKKGDEVALTFQGVTTTVGNNAQEITQYLDSIGNNQFAGAMAERAKTLDGAMANLGDTVDEVFRTVSSLGIGGIIADGARLASASLSDLITMLNTFNVASASSSESSLMFRATQDAVAVVFETVLAIGTNVKYVLTQIGNELGGMAAQAVQLAKLNFAGAAAIRQQMVQDAEAGRKAVDTQTNAILNARRIQAAIDSGKGTDEPRFARMLTQKKVWTENNELTKDQIKLLNELSGVSNDYQADLSALKSAYDKGNLTQGQYVKYVEQLIAKQPGIKKGHDEGRKAAEETAKILAELSGVTASYQEDLTRLDKMRKSGLITEAQYIELVEQLIAKQPAAKKQIEEMKKAREADWKIIEARNKAVEEAAKLEAQYQAAKDAQAFEDAWERDQQALKKIEDRIKAGRTMLEQMTFENSLLTMTSQQRAIATAEREMERQGIVKGTEAYIKYADAIKQAVLDKEAITEVQNFWSSIEQTAHSVWVDVANGGESAFRKIGQTLKAAVLDMLWQMTGRKWLISLGASMGVPGAAMAQQQMGGMAGNMGMSAVSNYVGEALAGVGQSIFGSQAAYSIGAGIAGQQGAMLAAQTAEFGLSGLAATAEAAGSAMASVASALPMLGAAVGVIALLASLDDSGTMHTGGLGSYSYKKGQATGDVVKEQSPGFFNLASSDYQKSSETASVQLAKGIVDILDSTASAFGKDAGYYAATAFADDTSKDGAWGGLTVKLADKIVADWGSGGDGFLGKVFADGEKGAKEYATAVGKDVRDYLLTQTPEWADEMLMALGDAPSIDALEGAVKSINDLQKELKAAGLGSLFEDITKEAKGGGRALRTDLVPWMQRIADKGGPMADTLKTIASYPNELLTAAGTGRDELVKIYAEGFQSGNISKAGQAVADTLVTSIENTMLTGAAGQIFDIANRGIITPILDAMLNGQTLAQALADGAIDATIAKISEKAAALAAIMNDPRIKELMTGLKTELGSALGGGGAAQSFNYAPQYQGASAAAVSQGQSDAEKAAEDAKKITDDLVGKQAELWIEKLRAQGRAEDALALEREAAIKGMDKEQIALYDANQQLQKQIDLLNSASAMRSEFESMGVELLRAQGLEAEALAAQRRIDVAGMSDAEIELYDLNAARRIEIDSITKLGELKSEYATIEIELLEAQGKKAEAAAKQRELDIATLDAAAIAQYDLNAARRAEIDGITRTKAAIADLWSTADNLADKFLSANDAATYKRTRLAGGLVDAGVIAESQIGGLVDVVGGMTSGQIKAEALRIASAYDVTTEAGAKAANVILKFAGAVYDMQSAAEKSATDAAYATLERAVNAQKKAAELGKKAATDLVTEVKTVFDALHTAVRDLYGEVDQGRLMLATNGLAFIDQALNAARTTGALPDSKALNEAVDSVRKNIGATEYATQVEADYNRLVLAGKLAELEGISGKQLSEAERQLKFAEKQLDTLEDVLINAKTQIDVMRGVDTSVISVEKAVGNLAAAIGSERAALIAAISTIGTAMSAKKMEQSVVGDAVGASRSIGASSSASARTSAAPAAGTTVAFDPALQQAASDLYAAQGAIGVYDAIKNSGYSLADAETMLGAPAGSFTDVAKSLGLPAFRNGGWHSGGWALVGEDGPEVAHLPPAHIYTAPQTARMMSGMGGDTARLESLVETLTTEVQSLKTELKNIKDSTAQFADQFDRVSAGGDRLLTEVAA